MSLNLLNLNEDTTEVVRFGVANNLADLALFCKPVVQNQGVLLYDSDFKLEKQIYSVVKSRFSSLKINSEGESISVHP